MPSTERGLSLAVDELIEIDISTWSDAAIADEFIALRRDVDRLEAVAAKLLVGVRDRLVPFGAGASSTPAWAQWKADQRFQETKASLDAVPCPTAPADLASALSKHEINRLLCDANVARIIFGPDRQPLDVGREHRTAPRWLRRAVGKRDGGCRYPGCDRRPNRCEVHHVWAWEDGGPTSVSNCIMLCSFHHHVVHRKRWTNTFDGITYAIRNQHGVRIE